MGMVVPALRLAWTIIQIISHTRRDRTSVSLAKPEEGSDAREGPNERSKPEDAANPEESREGAVQSKVNYLKCPGNIWSPDELAEGTVDVPSVPGAYGWYFNCLPPGVPKAPYFGRNGWMLLYVGITNDLERRLLKMHLGHSASVSTLQESLSCLLVGESAHEWLLEHGRVAFVRDPQPEHIEDAALQEFGELLPLNIKKNPANPIRPVLKKLRKEAKT